MPYRTNAANDLSDTTVEVETNDVFISVHYLDFDDTLKKWECAFIGKPVAEFLYNNKVQIDSNSGSRQYSLWYGKANSYFILIGCDYINTNRVLKISKNIISRKEIVVVKKYVDRELLVMIR